MGNYAFIDSNNIYLGLEELGWRVDYKKFRRYLEEKHNITKAYQFFGYMKKNEGLYRDLRKAGYELKFKEVIHDHTGKPKGNIDTELTLQAMIDYGKYEQAVIIASDGDYNCLVRHLLNQGKLKIVLATEPEATSSLLKRGSGKDNYKIDFLNYKHIKNQIQYIK